MTDVRLAGMPEGDTIYRAAQTSNKALAGKTVRSFRSNVPKIRANEVTGRVERVESAGKNLLVHFSNGKTLHTHMRMNGTWHIYKTGERWFIPEHLMRVAIDVGDYVAVCFKAPVVRLLNTKAIAKDEQLGKLGPDLLKPVEEDAAAIRSLMRARNNDEIGSVLLNQSVLAGIGNVYKSEVLFIERINPFVAVGCLDDSTLDRLIKASGKLLKMNATGSSRRTRFSSDGGPLWVYNRARRPCYKCGTPIEMRRQNPNARSTYFCPICQGS